MAKTIGGNTNTYDDVIAPLAITLNTSTYTTLLSPDVNRIGYTLGNLSNNTILIKEKVADDPDSADRGYPFFGRSVISREAPNIPIGEISAKALTGSPSILVTDY